MGKLVRSVKKAGKAATKVARKAEWEVTKGRAKMAVWKAKRKVKKVMKKKR